MARTASAARRLVMPVGMSGWQSRWFDGIDDRVQGAGVPLVGDVAYTLAAWLRETRSLGATGIALQSGNNVANESAWIGVDGAGRFSGGHTGGSVLTGGRASDRGWHRVCVTKLAGADWPILYVDGVQVSIAGLGSTLAGAGAPYLGRSASGTAPFPGNIWDARIYSRTWSPAEVAQDYLGEWVDPTGLARWWKLEGTTAATTHEEIGGTDDAVTGALISPMAPFRLRRVVEDVPAAPRYYQTVYTSVPHHVSIDAGAGDYSGMLWAHFPRISATRRGLFCKYDFGAGTGLWVYGEGGNLAHRTTAAAANTLCSCPSLAPGWHHIAFRRSGTTVDLWADGSLVASATGVLRDMTNASALEFGRWVNDNYPWIGAAGDILWRKGAVFTPEEIRAHYLTGTVPTGLTCHWPCREGAGTNVADIVGGRDGTLTAASWTTSTRCKARTASPARGAA